MILWGAPSGDKTGDPAGAPVQNPPPSGSKYHYLGKLAGCVGSDVMVMSIYRHTNKGFNMFQLPHRSTNERPRFMMICRGKKHVRLVWVPCWLAGYILVGKCGKRLKSDLPKGFDRTDRTMDFYRNGGFLK